MKLASPRAKDRSDVAAMIVSGAVDVAALRATIGDDDALAKRLAEAVAEATRDEEG
jgi:hypothetical protein